MSNTEERSKQQDFQISTTSLRIAKNSETKQNIKYIYIQSLLFFHHDPIDSFQLFLVQYWIKLPFCQRQFGRTQECFILFFRIISVVIAFDLSSVAPESMGDTNLDVVDRLSGCITLDDKVPESPIFFGDVDLGRSQLQRTGSLFNLFFPRLNRT